MLLEKKIIGCVIQSFITAKIIVFYDVHVIWWIDTIILEEPGFSIFSIGGKNILTNLPKYRVKHPKNHSQK
jgi:hypothetical protein